ncbi:hypothetical protein IA57_02310 [Mangrovimonas yunxiaonensis]|uniref:Lipoprotein n=1 Tax=Mangrovimonas yunxiaonensis TaxID=1197477 RepID=A0A084TLZ2_9FLAO|nr:hypothetical protein [Mangrovimonas yunxiaonensis]KFB01728.1 hypothetical protein IA57_02310 [Mangrovimonas yunxiaonensis]GGH40640.1 hypothetical protein GCM10011364_10890 [Mangrovimonas yunxiaonensis]
MKKYLIISLLSLFFVFVSCNNDDDTPPTCGCDSKTINDVSVAEVDNLVATIGYRHNEEFYSAYDVEYNNHFMIVVRTSEPSNLIWIIVVCNEDFLNNEFDYLKEETYEGERPQIAFSGKLKKICYIPPSNASYSFDLVKLTSIEAL